MSKNTTAAATFYPELIYEDADAAIGWLNSTFGFEQRELVRDEDGAIVHAELSFGGAIVMLGSAGGGREPFSSLPTGGRLIYCGTGEIDSLHDRAAAGGAEIVVPPTDTHYGSRDFAARDPEGNIWAFGTYAPTAEA